jgi:Txe/YoeB family toxin of toxin-antitoxin system
MKATWDVIFTKQAIKDLDHIKAAGLTNKVKTLTSVLQENPFQTPPPYEKLVGNLAGFYSRRINIQHRLVYMVDETDQQVKILRMWTHYKL